MPEGNHEDSTTRETVAGGPVPIRMVVLESQNIARKGICALLSALRVGVLVGEPGQNRTTYSESIPCRRA